MKVFVSLVRRLSRAPMWSALCLACCAIPTHGEVHVSAYVGGAVTRAANVLLEQSAPGAHLLFERVPFEGRSFQSPVYYGFRAGYFLTRRFGLEAEFVHLKIYADLDRPVTVRGTLAGAEVREQAPMSRYAAQFEVSHGLNLVLVNGVIRQPLLGGREPANARLLFVGRAGVGPTIPRPEVIVFGNAGGRYQGGPVATQGAAGVEVRLWRGLHVHTEYKYTFTPASFEIPNGRASLHVHSHHVVTGFGFHF